MTSEELIIKNSSVMIGRNVYNQFLRTYALEPYKDGKYYSDCSSFVCAAYKAGGYDIGWKNSYGLESTDKLHTIHVDYMYNGNHIKDADKVLHIADLIIWNGHVEMVHSIKDGIVYVQGHGSDVPKIEKLYDVERWNNGLPIVRRMRFNEEKNDKPTNFNQTFKVLYCVQCGAFNNRDNANRLQKELVNKGFIGFVYDGHDGYFRVQVGAFELKENADRYLEKVKAAGFSSAYVRVK